MSGGGGGTTTVQKADPWTGMQHALSTLYESLQGAYGAGNLAPPINTGQIANLDPQFSTAFNLATGGNMLAANLAERLASGDTSVSPGLFELNNIANGNDASTATLTQFVNGGYINHAAGGGSQL